MKARKLIAILIAVMMLMSVIAPMAVADDEEPVIVPAYQENVECQRDGQTLRGILRVPAHVEGEKVPIVILSHGFMSSNGELSNLANALANAGYASVRFNFMGTQNSDGTFLDVTVWTEVADLHAILDYVETLDIVDKDNIYLQGNSYGGLVTSLVAPERASEIRAVCLWFPAMCAGDDARDGHIQDATFDVNNVPETLRVQRSYVSRQFILDQMALDPYEPAAEYEGDVLVLHGTADYMVPISGSEKLVSMYPHAVLSPVEGASHGFYGQYANIGAQRMIEFLNAHRYAVIGTTAAAKSGETATVDVIYNGQEPISTVTVKISSELEVASVDSDLDVFEYNPADGWTIVYQGDGIKSGDVIFTISFDIPEGIPNSEYIVRLDVQAATDLDAGVVEVNSGYGYVVVDNQCPPGDVTMDGQLTNADLILIARYLVHLIDFNKEQLGLADFNDDGAVNNTDLVLVARAVVAD